MDRNDDQFMNDDFDTMPEDHPHQNEPQNDNPQPVADNDQEYLMQLLAFLRDRLSNASSMPLTNKRLVDAGECLEIVDDIERNLPAAIQYAQQVVDERSRIIADAKRVVANGELSVKSKIDAAHARSEKIIDDAHMEAQRTIEEADERAINIIKGGETHARGLIDQNAIKLAAQNEARSIVNEARAEANDRRQAAAAYCDDLHIDAERVLQSAIDLIRKHRQDQRNAPL